MGVTGANGFPCCGKESVDTAESQRIYSQFQPVQDEDEMELEKELLELEPPYKEVLNPDPKLGPEWKPQAFEQPELCSGVVGKPEVKPKAEPKLQVANLEPYNEDPKPQGPRLESLHPHPEGLRQQDISQWSMKSNSSYLGFAEKEKVSPDHRSIRVQTSRHLFWSDKLIQASEHSLQEKTQKSPTRTSRHPKKPSVSEDTLYSKKLLQDPSDQPAPLDSGSPQPPSPGPPCSPPTIGLAELINLASSLAVASSSKTDLPSLKHLIKAPPQKATEPSAEATTDGPKQEKPSQDLPPEKPLETRELPKAPKEEDRRLPHPYLDFSKPGFKRATIEGEVKFLQSPNMSPQPQGAEKEQQRAENQAITISKENVQVTRARSITPPSHCPQNPLQREPPPQKPQQLFSRDPGEGQASRTQKRRPQKRAALPTQMEPAAAAAPGAEQASQRAREFKGLGAHAVQSGPSAMSQSFADKNLLPLTPRQLAAFQDVFKLFSSSPAGTMDMRSMKAALCNAGVQLSPQEMCEALGQADLDGDGSVSFEDFLGVLTDSHRLAQCLGKVRNSRVCDPHGLQTLFLETLFKLMSLGFVPYKSAQEVMSYYSRKQRSLRLNCSWKGGPRCHGSTGRSHAGLAFFCQATRLSGLSNAELARTLQGLHKAGARSPYSQVPTLNGRMQPECYPQNRTSRPEVRLPKSYRRSRPKRQVDREGSWASHWGICAPRSWLPPPQL